MSSQTHKSEKVQCSDIPAYAVDLINSIAKKEGFTEYTVTSEAGSSHGDGFLGIMIRIAINGTKRLEGVSTPVKLSLIVKLPPDNKARREMFHTKDAFESEIFSYDVLLPAFVNLQQDKGVVKEDGFFRFPKSYGTFADTETGNYVLIMEDLAVRGYEMRNKFEKLNFAHAKLVMTELGRYHALSFALRDQRPEIFAEFRKRRPTFMLKMLDNDMSKGFWSQKYEEASKTLAPEEKEFADKIVLLGKTYVERMRECCEEDAAEPFGVMNHGDCWNNNMMYRYGVDKKKPNEMCLIDWQITQWCSPAMDLSHYIFSSTEKELRDEHYDDLLRVYYESLSVLLRRLGSDSEKLFKFSDLQDQLRKFGRYGLIMSPMVIMISMAKPEDIPDMDQIAEDQQNEDNYDGMKKTDDLGYKKRMADVIRDFFTYGFDL